MDRENKFYRVAYSAAKATIGFFYPVKVLGTANIPSGAAVICANHSSWVDPFLMAFAFTKKEHLCLMAKIELFRSKLVGGILRAIGTFPVDRGKADISAMRIALRYLRNGKKLGVFPEGTRAEHDGEIVAKGGAVRLAEKADVPVVPVYIPRRKKLFQRLTIVIGRPFRIEHSDKKRSGEDYEKLAGEIMEEIVEMGTISEDNTVTKL